VHEIEIPSESEGATNEPEPGVDTPTQAEKAGAR
jgi:hypothetical protein